MNKKSNKAPGKSLPPQPQAAVSQPKIVIPSQVRQKQILLACAIGSLDDLKKLIEPGLMLEFGGSISVDPRKVAFQIDKNAPFLTAVRFGHLELVEYFIDCLKMTDIETIFYALKLSISHQPLDIFRYIAEVFEKQIDLAKVSEKQIDSAKVSENPIDFSSSDFWLLRNSITNGNLEIAKYLIDHHASASQLKKDISHCVVLTLSLQKYDIFWYLVEKLKEKIDYTAGKESVLEKAVNIGNFEIFKWILEDSGARIDIAENSHRIFQNAYAKISNAGSAPDTPREKIVSYILTNCYALTEEQINSFDYTAFTQSILESQIDHLHKRRETIREILKNELTDEQEIHKRLVTYLKSSAVTALLSLSVNSDTADEPHNITVANLEACSSAIESSSTTIKRKWRTAI